MAEGGMLAWKRQTIDEHRGPVTNYQNLNLPLPAPPKGMIWIQDTSTQEWTLKVEQEISSSKEGNDSKSLDENFVWHTVKSTDTFQGICLKYKVSATVLRRLNRFSGTNLGLAPNPLRIPLSLKSSSNPYKEQSEDPCPIRAIIRACPELTQKEAKCYLELHDGDITMAIKDALSPMPL
jgi:hypothetical protein